MALVDINWHPTPRELKRFGVSNLVILGVAGALFYWRGHTDLAWGFWIVGVATGLTGMTGTVVALPGYYLFMAVGLVMGNVVGRVLVGLFYYLLITPMGLVMRLIGRDPLRLRAPADASTYWCDIHAPTEKARYERQF